MRISTFIAITIAALTFSGCLFNKFEGKVTGEAFPPDLYLYNETNRTIYYIVIEQNELALIDLALGDHSDWPKIPAGKKAEIPFSEIAFYDEGDTNVWVYWTTDDDDTGSFTVSLE